MELEFIRNLIEPNDTKMVLLVMDGFGGLPIKPGSPTELEAAETPHMDHLAANGICGLQQPVGPGITPGSGPGHLGLSGYDPLKFQAAAIAAYPMYRGVAKLVGMDLLSTGSAIEEEFKVLEDHWDRADEIPWLAARSGDIVVKSMPK